MDWRVFIRRRWRCTTRSTLSCQSLRWETCLCPSKGHWSAVSLCAESLFQRTVSMCTFVSFTLSLRLPCSPEKITEWNLNPTIIDELVDAGAYQSCLTASLAYVSVERMDGCIDLRVTWSISIAYSSWMFKSIAIESVHAMWRVWPIDIWRERVAYLLCF